MSRVRLVGVLSSVVLLAGVLSGCSGDPDATPTPSGDATEESTATPDATDTPTPTPTEDPWASTIATAPGDTVDIYAAAGDAAPERTIAAAEAVSLPGQIPLTFLVLDTEDDWLQVALPVRPNGSTGWVKAADVTLSTTDFSIEVSLTDHVLRLYDAGEVVMEVSVGVGRAEVPTPGGVYYIKELLQPPTPGGVYGAYAYGLSGYSPVLESFAGGEGVIGIHGTNEPELVGTDVSHGCIRMLDADVTRLVTEFGLPLGTPVQILE
jgi:lipoprotein-anchoring transpeptidase ErfK/SrfK